MKLTEIVIGTEADRQIYNVVEVANRLLRVCSESVAGVGCFTPLRLMRLGCGKQAVHEHAPNRDSERQWDGAVLVAVSLWYSDGHNVVEVTCVYVYVYVYLYVGGDPSYLVNNSYKMKRETFVLR